MAGKLFETRRIAKRVREERSPAASGYRSAAQTFRARVGRRTEIVAWAGFPAERAELI
jgi:hypothetical protein